jgi:CheY-like chemotaxis protein
MSGARVLLVDDEFAGAEVLALILAGEGYHVTTVPDGRQALARLEEAAPDVVVTDFMMPGMNGAELVDMIRELPKYAHVPVLMISGAPEAALRRYQTKYQAFLRKPFGLEQFLRTVRRLRGAAEEETGPVPL